MEPNNNVAEDVDRLLQAAVWLVVVGLVLMLMYLIAGFQAWSVGLGIFLGGPLLLVGMLLYVISVVRDLYLHNVLGNERDVEQP